jgi:hypothetical protein
MILYINYQVVTMQRSKSELDDISTSQHRLLTLFFIILSQFIRILKFSFPYSTYHFISYSITTVRQLKFSTEKSTRTSIWMLPFLCTMQLQNGSQFVVS